MARHAAVRRCKLRGGEGKYLLKKAMEPHLPHDVLYRPKMGFAVPLARWFRGPLRERVRDAVLGERLARDRLSSTRRYLEHLVDAHQSGRARLQRAAVGAADVRRVPCEGRRSDRGRRNPA